MIINLILDCIDIDVLGVQVNNFDFGVLGDIRETRLHTPFDAAVVFDANMGFAGVNLDNGQPGTVRAEARPGTRLLR